MQRYSPLVSRLMLVSSLLAVGFLQPGFAQRYSPQELAISVYGIDLHGRPDGVGAFCGGAAQTGGAAPSVPQAIASSGCHGAKLQESTTGELVLKLLDGMNLKMDAGRPFDKVADANMATYIDQSSLVYPLHGAFTLYECVSVKTHPESKGKNCNSVEQPDSTGTCYKVTSGDWWCDMNLKVEQMHLQGEKFEKEWDNQWTHRGVPPPTPFQKLAAK